MDLAVMESFNPRAVEKVERLLDVLEQMAKHPRLRDAFAIYGGTALNLFMLDVPRLSVDIDATYIGSIDKEEMLAAKPIIEQAILEVAQTLGYSLELGRAEHAGRTFFLGYHGKYGHDNVKIDFTYLNRVPLFPRTKRSVLLRNDLAIPLLSDAEILGGKVKAYFSRIKVRDIYDVTKLADLLESIEANEERDLFHKVLLYKASLSAAFPFGFIGRESRFANRQEELETELYPMLRKNDILPTLAELMESAARFVDTWVLPRNSGEEKYLQRLEQADFDPSLLFGAGDVALRAASSPEAAWKVANLKNMR